VHRNAFARVEVQARSPETVGGYVQQRLELGRAVSDHAQIVGEREHSVFRRVRLDSPYDVVDRKNEQKSTQWVPLYNTGLDIYLSGGAHSGGYGTGRPVVNVSDELRNGRSRTHHP